MIAVDLTRVIVDEEKREQLIVLKERDGLRILSIVIGIAEATAIRMKLSRTFPARPLTHDLVAAVILSLGGRVERVVIDKILEGTFHAKLYVEDKDGVVKIIDSRPSDSIVLSLSFKAPLFVEDDVFKSLSK
ncbi:MAG: bifunctional nuclease family protein [Candidatus Omnitrophica bacterium]|nr:bifunctional nuclease family protein [Candidatus Omnitrophota bacterium]